VTPASSPTCSSACSEADVLIIDELGFVPFGRAGGELLFNLITSAMSAAPRASTLMSPLPNASRYFAGDEKLTTALLDRLAH
jgi:DNA replication protein DnaC